MRPRTSPFLKILDDHIRHGNVALARRELRRGTKGRIPRELAADVASLARRASLPDLTLRLLHPIVRAVKPLAVPATAREKGEYAAALVRIGAVEEGEALLEPLDGRAHPEIPFFKATALVSQWRYAESIPLLESYLASDGIDDYRRLVGNVNLAAAHLSIGRIDEAGKLLPVLAAETARKKLFLLHGNILELSAQLAIVGKQWDAAERFLHDASRALERAGGLDAFFVEKWRVSLDFLRLGGAQGPRRALATLRSDSWRRGHWETVRSCDRLEAVVLKDPAILARVYFGTPFAGFRDVLFEAFGESARLPAHYDWVPDWGAVPPTILDLASGAGSPRGGVLRPGLSLHRLVVTLASDFYRPHRVAALFSRLHAGECFNPHSSPARVHTAVSRLRAWLGKQRLPVEIEEVDGAYRFRGGACALRASRSESRVSRHAWSLDRLRRKWPEAPFSVKEAAALLETSTSSAQRILESAREAGEVDRTGKARASRYRFVDPAR